MKTTLKNIKNYTISYIARELFQSRYRYDFFDFNKEQILNKSLQLRHEVYCEELAYEDSNNHKIETDQFDKFATGVVISSKYGKAISSVRIIPKNSHYTIPCLTVLEKEHPTKYNNVLKQINHLKYAEVSRFLILKSFRHKNHFFKDYILLVLLTATFKLAEDYDFIIFMCEKKLFLFLERLGLPVEFLTKEPIEHRGARYLIKMDIKKIKPSIKKPSFYLAIIRSILCLMETQERKHILKIILALESIIAFVMLASGVSPLPFVT